MTLKRIAQTAKRYGLVTSSKSRPASSQRFRSSEHQAIDVIPAAEATHREIVLNNCTVQPTPEQLEAIRRLQTPDSGD